MARLFDDASSEYLYQTIGTPVADEPFAMCAWVNLDDDSAEQCIICLADGDAVMRHSLHVLSSSRTISVQSRADAVVAAATSAALTLNQWAHLCGIYTADNDRRAFLDGGNKGTNATSTAVTGLDRSAIARLYQNGSWYFPASGKIAESAVFNLSGYPGATNSDKGDYFETYVLPALAVRYSPQFFPGLVAYWPLGGLKSSDNAANNANGDRDIVGGYHMSPFNTPSVADHPPIIYPIGPRWFPAAVAGGYTVPLQLILECAQ